MGAVLDKIGKTGNFGLEITVRTQSASGQLVYNQASAKQLAAEILDARTLCY